MDTPRVTLKQVAAAAGVHVSTAWRALKNGTYVDPGKRARIREKAKELGYAPDPMLTALSHYRRKQHPPAYQSTLAWMNCFSRRKDYNEAIHIRAYFEGAQTFAASMGFRLEEFWLAEPRMSAARALGILNARNIRGLVFAPQPDPNSRISLDLEGFSCVSIGHSLICPRLHVVCNHQHSTTMTSLRELASLGHERIGMISATDTLRRTEHNFESPYYFFQSTQPDAQRIPLFTIKGRDEPANVATHRDACLEWFKRYRPTAIISTVSEVRDWLEAAGFAVPSSVSLATLSRIHDANWSGIDQQENTIGARAIELLISLFQSGERGSPSTPIHLLVEGRWIHGDSTKRIAPPVEEILSNLS